jgi:hypothetical protein
MDIYRRPQTPRKTGESPTGGQKGHKGQTLTMVESPDETIVHAVPFYEYRTFLTLSLVVSTNGLPGTFSGEWIIFKTGK